MQRANYSDKAIVIDILSCAFAENQSVNYIVKQDHKRLRRIRNLMSYSFDTCFRFGEIWLSDDKTGCALVVLPDRKRFTLRSILWDIKLMYSCMGISNTGKAMLRESKIKKLQPDTPLYYLWFIGVQPQAQHRGTGTALMIGIIAEAKRLERIICLETSTVTNLPWYQRFGFNVYTELNLGYQLYFLKRG
ncbi:N-acetyltransferase [Segetibacter sp. 3557_3]|uniref:GNAT family N-acetyltransferase n=1 Tax=Segetibacter sp. 3557_3 TaxID=2547429 RepID=UPI001058C4FC|nr:GNAT family N-acetyltransferase [Segetibacter sp. 3557_3]TDH27002.1 N-acetyltransferase [Segetibacter sp. 3557_3]